jgi:hypothetical protein
MEPCAAISTAVPAVSGGFLARAQENETINRRLSRQTNEYPFVKPKCERFRATRHYSFYIRQIPLRPLPFVSNPVVFAAPTFVINRQQKSGEAGVSRVLAVTDYAAESRPRGPCFLTQAA